MEPVVLTEKKEWSSIDIFLFSNGQQYSPPRKYHLRAEELQWWGPTMSYLGRTHYGSGHSTIELYAIDGKKINGPLELTNGGAYVAVEPPDSFVNTGYEEYLLKASRSWEKRLAQKCYNTEMSNPDLKHGKDPGIQSNIVENDISENNADTTSLNVDTNAITSQKSRIPKPYQRLQRKSNASAKQIQKKKSFDTRNATLKRICAETDEVFPCPKKIPLKKNGCINRKPSIQRKVNEITNKGTTTCCKKRASIKEEINPNIEISSNRNTHDTASIKEPQIIDLYNIYNNNETGLMPQKKDSETYSMIDNSIFGQNIIADDKIPVQDEHIHRNVTEKQESGKDSSSKLKQINDYEISDNLQDTFFAKNETRDGNKDNIILMDNKENKSYDAVISSRSEKQVVDEYVAYMNKGGLLLLKLKVKLKDCKTIFNKDKSKNIQMAASLGNLPKTEKTSQVDINISFSGELCKSNDHQYPQDKSLQSLLNKLYAQDGNDVTNKNPRIIILQCACRDNSAKHNFCTCESKNEARLSHNLNETFTRCECHNDSIKTFINEYTMTNGVLPQFAEETNDNRPSVTNGTRVKDLAQKFENRKSNNINNNNDSNKNTSTSENLRRSLLLTKINGASAQKRDIENRIGEYNDSNSEIVSNKSTQTDWCNVLLEARRHEDENYTFHLPPLYLLKQYNL